MMDPKTLSVFAGHHPVDMDDEDHNIPDGYTDESSGIVLDIAAAREELLAKSDMDIAMETASKWAARAVACFQLLAETQDASWLTRGEEYKHEAVEHAELVYDGGATVNAIEDAMAIALGGPEAVEAEPENEEPAEPEMSDEEPAHEELA